METNKEMKINDDKPLFTSDDNQNLDVAKNEIKIDHIYNNATKNIVKSTNEHYEEKKSTLQKEIGNF